MELKEVVINQTDDKKNSDKFDAVADQYAAMYTWNTPAGHSFRARRKLAHKMLGSGNLGALLDVGGASGVYFEELKSQVKFYSIIDISPQMIEIAKKINAGGVPLDCQVASIYSLPYEDQYFDNIIAMGVFEYLERPWDALEELKRVSKDGATILVSFTNAHSPMRRLSSFIYKTAKGKKIFDRLFTRKEVADAAQKLNLEIVDTKGYNAQFIPFPFTWWFKPVAFALAALLEPALNVISPYLGTAYTVQFRKKS